MYADHFQEAGASLMDTDVPGLSQLRRILISVFFASVGLSCVYLIPAFAEYLGANYLQLGYIGTIRSLPYMFLPVIIGYLGDRFNRHMLFSSSVFVTGAATLMLAGARTIENILLVQVFLGIGFSFFWPLSEAMVSETAPLRDRTAALGTYGVAWGSGFLIGPLIGGFIAGQVGFQTAFLVAGVAVLMTAAASVAAIHEPMKIRSQKTQIHARPQWKLVSELWPVLATQVPYGIVFAFIVSIFPGYAIQSGLTPFEVGILVSGFSLTRIVMFSLSGTFGRIGEKKSIIFSSAGIASALALILINRGFLALLTDMCLLGVFIGIFYPQTVGYISKRSPSTNLGFSIGLYETIFGIGFAVGPLMSGSIAQIAGPEVAILVLVVVALSIIPIVVPSKPLQVAIGDIR